MTALDGWLQRWRGLGASAGPAASAGLAGASEAFARFAADYARLAAAPPAAGAARDAWLGRLETLARRFYAEVLPAWPADASTGLSAAATAWSAQLGKIAQATAASFGARLLREDRPQTLRASFDVWIDCAETVFQAAARTPAYAAAQAALLNELVRLRLAQQGLVDSASRLAGVPTRAEVDALHDTVRELRRQLDARPVTPAPTRRRRGR